MTAAWGAPGTAGRNRDGERSGRTVALAGMAAGGALAARAGNNRLGELRAERDHVVRANVGRVQQARATERAAGYKRSVAVRRVKAATRQQRRLERWDDSQDLRPLRVREPGRRGATTLDQLSSRRSERYFLSSRLRGATERAAAAAPAAMAEHTRATAGLRSATARAKQEIGGVKAAQTGASRRARVAVRTGRAAAAVGAAGALASAVSTERARSRAAQRPQQPPRPAPQARRHDTTEADRYRAMSSAGGLLPATSVLRPRKDSRAPAGLETMSRTWLAEHGRSTR